MRKVLLAIAIAMGTVAPVEAADTADVIAVALQWTEAFNRGGLDSDKTGWLVSGVAWADR